MRGGGLAGETSIELVHEFAHVRCRHGITRAEAAESARDIVGMCPSHTVVKSDIERALDLWCQHERLDMRDAIFAAQALNRGIDAILSPDRGFDSIPGLERIDPADAEAVATLKMKFGVLQFPGTCDEVDALHAARRVGDAELLWHGERDLKGADAIVVPGGFSYGDYLRAGAIARFSPVMESVIAFASDGGLVLGICNGFQVLVRGAAAARGAVAEREPALHLQAGASSMWWRPTPRSPAPAGVDRELMGSDVQRMADSSGRSLSIPAKHSWGRYYADEPTLASMREHGQVVLRYAPGENFNGSLDDIAGVRNEQGNVFGLMPHPEHAVDELTRLDRRAVHLRVDAHGGGGRRV